MQKEFVANVESANKSAVEAMKSLGEMQIKTMERLTETQLAATSAFMNGSVKQLQALAATKDLQTAVSSQSQYISELNESIVDNSKAVAGILTEARDDFSKWVEDGMKAAMDTPLAKAAKKA